MRLNTIIAGIILLATVSCNSGGDMPGEEMGAQDKVNHIFHNSQGTAREAAFIALTHWRSNSIQDSWFLIDKLIVIADSADTKYHKPAFDAMMTEIKKSEYFNDHFYHYRRIMPSASSTEEKERVLEAIGDHPAYLALLFLGEYLEDKELGAMAARSALKVCIPELGGIAGFTGPQVREIVEKILDMEQVASEGDNRKYMEDFLAKLPEDKLYIAPRPEEGFVSLFHGTNLEGWIGDTLTYRVENGLIVVQPEENNGGGRLSTEKQYSNFIYRFEFQLTPGANNGIGIRDGLEGDAAYQAMEIQVLDNTAKGYANLGASQYHGSVYGVIAAERGALRPLGEWNEQEIWIKDNDIKITLNGIVILEGNLAEAVADRSNVAKSHPGLKRTLGHISFLGHGSVVRFRNIRIKEI